MYWRAEQKKKKIYLERQQRRRNEPSILFHYHSVRVTNGPARIVRSVHGCNVCIARQIKQLARFNEFKHLYNAYFISSLERFRLTQCVIPCTRRALSYTARAARRPAGFSSLSWTDAPRPPARGEPRASTRPTVRGGPHNTRIPFGPNPHC